MAQCQYCGFVYRDDVQYCPVCFGTLQKNSGGAAIDLWDSRLLGAKRTVDLMLDQRKLSDLSVGLDIVNEIGFVSYEIGGKVYTRKCKLPWKLWKMDTVEEQHLFEGCLSGLKLYFEKNQIGKIRSVALTVPYAFSYLQKKCIRNIAARVGIELKAMDTAGVFYSFCRCRKNPNATVYEINCNLQSNFFEITGVEIGDGVCESLGTTGLEFKDGWKSLSGNEFEKRLRSESRQYLRDIGLIDAGDHVTDYHREIFINMIGQKSDLLDGVLNELLGSYTEGYPRNASVGCFLQVLKKERKNAFSSEMLRLATQDKSIWLGLGTGGEYKICIERYTTLPTKKAVRLLLSTETELNVYEGNIMNPRYDRLLTRISLDQFNLKEGHEIECTLEAEFTGEVSLRIGNHDGNIVLDSFEL